MNGRLAGAGGCRFQYCSTSFVRVRTHRVASAQSRGRECAVAKTHIACRLIDWS